jgi:plastocyanin
MSPEPRRAKLRPPIVEPKRDEKEEAMRRALGLAVATTLALALVAGSASGVGTTVRVTNFDFKPATVRIQKGGRVTWKNIAGRHTVTFKNGSFHRVLSGDERVTKTFRRRGTFRYVCRFHTALGQRGKVIVE